MRKLILTSILMLLVLMSSAQDRADQQALSDPKSFSFILFGDPQGYTKYDLNQPIFDLTTAWVADNIDPLNIKAVLCTGDLVEQNENIVLNRKMLNQTSTEMWQASSRAFERLDNKIPYIVSCGNHDYGFKHSENGITNFPKYFPFERNSTWRDICISNFPNRNNESSIENAAFEFKLDNWPPILVISTEFHPRDEVLEWSKKLVAEERFKDYFVIFMTHAYLTSGSNAKHLDQNNYDLKNGNTGKQIWDKLIYPSSNIKLVICGHTGDGNGKYEDNVSYISNKNQSGETVNQMMFNVQYVGGGPEGNGGDGWLRIMEFLPNGKTIKIRTYSPLFGISSLTKHLAHRAEKFDQFDITYN